ncbi:MAG: protein kinase [Myxococcales bacterium]|nr:protein kinase [Myxococcales bacterium]
MTTTTRTDGTPNSPMTGRLLGDFVVHQQIGAGGFGAVYLAEQISLGREAVIKIPLARADADSAFAAQFLREAQFASQLDHPYAAHIYAFGVEEDGTLWTAMELVRGTPLNELLKKHGPLPVEKFVPLFDKLCEVVHTAHEQGIIHRDLKPANVMVIARAGRLLPKLLDLGIAKLSGSSGAAEGGDDAADSPTTAQPPSTDTPASVIGTQASAAHSDSQRSGATETISAKPTVGPGLTKLRAMTLDASALPVQKSDTIGTPAYMAPEQWVPTIPTDARTDVYALGILAYEVLTGRLPFKGKNSMELARAHARQAPPPLGGDLPPALDAVIAKALAKRPANRYQTAVELAAAMRKATGFDQEPVKLPTLDAALREALLSTAPQPLAEAVSALDSVRNAHQGLSAVFQIMRVTTRLLGNLSLACWTHYGTLAERGQPDVARALGQLKRHGLDEMEWLDLAELIAVQFTDRRDSAPLPELIELFCPDTSRTTSRTSDEPSERSAVSRAMRALVATKDHYETALAPDAATTKRLLEETMPQLQVALAGLAWLHDYLLVVPHGETADRWMGTRRQPRPVVPLQAGAEVTSGEPLLVTQDGAPVLRLAPFFQVSAPAPGEDAELFVLDGSGRSGARLVSMPTGFEKSDHTLWGWLSTQVAIEALDSERKLNERAPYRGLAAFTADDADMFVGRERETESVANRLRVTAMLGIVGPSGAGKSSFIQAGVLPALGSHWKSVIVRPGGSPLLALRTMVRGLEGLETTTDEALAGAGLGNVLRAWATARKQSLMLYVDQFEELFTLCHDVAERKAYVDMLLQASLSPADPIRVVFTVRDDFLLRCQQLEALRDRLVSGLQLLATPTPDDLLRILIEPARRAGYEFDDPALPGEMVQAIADMPSALPLLSFTAAQLWELRDRQASKLARKAYESLGGVGGALAQHAERVLGAMSSEAQGLVRIVFRNLVTADGTRAILTRAEALEILGKHADAETTLEALIHARLLTASEGAGSLDRIEVVHEALLSAWPRLINWRREDAEGARMRDQLRAAARQWVGRNRDKGLLWRGDLLAEYRLWRSRYPSRVTDLEESFAAASVASDVKRKRIIRGLGAVVLVSLTISTIVFAGLRSKAQRSETSAKVSAARAEQQLVENYTDQAAGALTNNNAVNSLLFAAEVIRRGSASSTIDHLATTAYKTAGAATATMLGHADQITSMEFSRDGMHILTASNDGTARIWKNGDLIQLLRAHPAGGRTVAAWLGASDFIATAGSDGVVKIWDAASGQLAAQRLLHGEGVFDLVWSEISGEIVSTGVREKVVGWNVSDGTTRTIFESPNSKNTFLWSKLDPRSGEVIILIASTTSNNTRLFSSLKKRLRSLGAVDYIINSIAISTTRPEIAIGADSGEILIIESADGRVKQRFVAHVGAVSDLAWSADDSYLVSGGADAMLHVYSRDKQGMLSSSPSRVLSGHKAAIRSVALLGHDRVISASIDGSAKEWSISRGLDLNTYSHGGSLSVLAVAKDQIQIATGARNGTAMVWNSQSVFLKRVFEPVTNADYNEEPPLIADEELVRAADGGIAIWNLKNGTKRLLPGEPGVVSQIAVLAASGRIVSWRTNGTLVWQRIVDGETVKTMPIESKGVYLLSGSPVDRERFLMGLTDGKLFIVDDSGIVSEGVVPNGYPTAVEWSADGSRVLVTIETKRLNRVILIDVTTGRLLAELPGAWRAATLSPDGQHIATLAELSSTLWLWNSQGKKIWETFQPGQIYTFTWSHDSTRIFAALIDGSISIVSRVSGNREGVLLGLKRSAQDLVVVDNGTRLYAAGADREVVGWSLSDLREIARWQTAPTTSWIVGNLTSNYVVTIDLDNTTVVNHIGRITSASLHANVLVYARCVVPESIRLATRLAGDWWESPSCETSKVTQATHFRAQLVQWARSIAKILHQEGSSSMDKLNMPRATPIAPTAREASAEKNLHFLAILRHRHKPQSRHTEGLVGGRHEPA